MLMKFAHRYQEVKLLQDIIKSYYIAQFLQWIKPKGHLCISLISMYAIVSLQHP